MSIKNDPALTTLNLLESRLQRLEFLLTGSSSSIGIPETMANTTRSNETVAARLENLEEDLRRLTTSSALAQEILRTYKRFPDLFTEQTTSTAARTMDPSTQASIILAHASSFPETASRLSSLKDLTVPSAEASAKLEQLGPKLLRVREVQERQMKQVTELRDRTAKVVEYWVTEGVVGNGEIWAEWESRVRDADKGVRRLERQRREAGN